MPNPLRTFWRQFNTVLAHPAGNDTPIISLLKLGLGMVLGWWIYVPVHELLHAAGCLVGGGTVSRLEIHPYYGGAVLAAIIPFVVSGGEYAGRLSAFDTGGSDGVYFLTIFAPFLLTLPSFRWLAAAARRGQVMLFGCAIPCAMAPLVSLTGDYFEMGSLLLYQIWSGPESSHRALISDDLFRLLTHTDINVPLSEATAFIAIAFLAGLALIWLTWLLADALCPKPTGEG